MSMVLFLNKMDRLINELKMNTLDAYHRMNNIVGQVNAILSSFYMKDLENSKIINSDEIDDSKLFILKN